MATTTAPRDYYIEDELEPRWPIGRCFAFATIVSVALWALIIWGTLSVLSAVFGL